MNKITVLGANPALQKTLQFKDLLAGKVNRAVSLDVCASGKGINFCRALKCWGKAEGELLQFAGGDNGKYIIKELEREEIRAATVITSAPTRCCMTCLNLASRETTELIEPSGSASAEEVELLLENARKSLENASAFAVCGTLPGNTDKAVYEKTVKYAADYGVPVLLDAYKNIEKLFRTGAKIILKINRDELAELTGAGMNVKTALKTLFSDFPVYRAAITDGPGTAYASDGKIFAEYELPCVEAVNPIGCGDTASSVLLSEMASGTVFADAFRYALAAASANCLTVIPGSYDKSSALCLAEQIKMKVSDF